MTAFRLLIILISWAFAIQAIAEGRQACFIRQLQPRPLNLFDPILRFTSTSEKIHQEIGAVLRSGEISSPRKFSENQNVYPLYLVKVTHQNKAYDAFFKPRILGDGFGYNRTPLEHVGYRLNLKLGMDYIPPSAYRTGLKIQAGGKTYTEGAIIYKIENFETKYDIGKYPQHDQAIMSDHRVLCVLMGNPDGHAKNFGLGNHWTDGKARPAFLDWGASLSNPDVSMFNYRAYKNSDPVTSIRRPTFEALKRLSLNDFLEEVQNKFITIEEARGILGRRDQIVQRTQEGRLKIIAE